MDVEKTIQFLLQNQAKHDAQIGQIAAQIGQMLEIANKLENVAAGLLEHARIVDRRLDALENG